MQRSAICWAYLQDLAPLSPKHSQVTISSSGTGSSTHLALEHLKVMAKVKITHVP